MSKAETHSQRPPQEWPTHGKVFETRADGTFGRCVSRVGLGFYVNRVVILVLMISMLFLCSWDAYLGYFGGTFWLGLVAFVVLSAEFVYVQREKWSPLFLEISADEVLLIRREKGRKSKVLQRLARNEISRIEVKRHGHTLVDIRSKGKKSIFLDEHGMTYEMVEKCASRLSEILDVPFVSAKGENLKISLEKAPKSAPDHALT